MPPSRHLAIDLGAESGRVVAGTLDGGRLAITEVARFPNGPVNQDDRLRWNLPALLAHVERGLGAAGPPVASIGIDTWGVDFGLADESGDLIEWPVCYRDPRTDGAVESFLARMDARELHARTGIQVLPINTLFQLEAMRRDADPALDRASGLLFMPDLIAHHLTGVRATEYTFATTTQLFNATTRTWDDAVLAAVGVSRSLLADPVAPGTVLGPLAGDLAARTGLGPVPVVAVGTHDTAGAVAAVPASGDDWAYVSSGTWSLVGVETRAPILTDAAREANLTNEGGVFGTVRVLKNVMGLWLLQRCRAAWAAERDWSYAELADAAREAPPLVSLIDPDRPVFLNPPDMVAAIRAECERAGEPAPDSVGAVARAILESLALKTACVLDLLRGACGRSIRCVHLIGGGSQNELLCKLTADATGLPVYAGPVEATAIGNLLMQAAGLGTVADHAALRAVVAASFPVRVYQPSSGPEWDAARARFARLIERGKEPER